MKTGMSLLLFMAVCGSVLAVESPVVTGKGGRMLENTAPHAEFWVNADRKAEITFYGDDMKPVAITEQVVAVTAEAPSGKVKLTLENQDGALVSAEQLPEGDGYTVVVQIKANADAKSENFRIPMHLETCGGCQRAEYACTCDHGGEEESHEGHGH